MQEALPAVTSRLPYPRAVAAGLGAAAASGLVWFAVVAFTDRHLSAVSMLVGLTVAHAVIWGARGKKGPGLQALGISITLVALLVVEAFAVRILVARELIDLGIETELAVMLPLDVFWNMVAAGITNDPPTVLFWGLALWYAITVPGKNRMFG